MSIEDVITEQAAEFGGLARPESAGEIARSIPSVISTLPGSILSALINVGFKRGDYTAHLAPSPAKPAERPAAADPHADLMTGVVAKIEWQRQQQQTAGMFPTRGLTAPRGK
jgi:hypothetical protein